MTHHPTAVQQLAALREYGEELDKATHAAQEASKLAEEREIETAEAERLLRMAETLYDLEFGSAYSVAQGNIPEREAAAKSDAGVRKKWEEAEAARFAWKRAKAIQSGAERAFTMAKEEVRNIRQRMSGYQSVAAMVRTEAEMQR